MKLKTTINHAMNLFQVFGYGDIFLELLSDNSLCLDLYTADELLWRQRQRCHGLLEQRCVGMDNRITAQCQC